MYYGNYYLSLEQSTYNANLIFNYLGSRGWSINAICGMLGNMMMESRINPGVWQNLDEGNVDVGFGLVQWTPATNYIVWASERGYNNYDEYGQLYPQLERIEYEFDNGLQYIETTSYPISASDFKVSTLSAEYLAEVFLKNYERAGVEVLDSRKEWAGYYFSMFNGETPETPPDVPDTPGSNTSNKKKHKYNFILFNRRRMNQWTGRRL